VSTDTTDKAAGISPEVAAAFIMLIAVLIFGLNYVVGRLAVGQVPA
jgi:hypothetical protein